MVDSEMVSTGFEDLKQSPLNGPNIRRESNEILRKSPGQESLAQDLKWKAIVCHGAVGLSQCEFAHRKIQGQPIDGNGRCC